MTPLRRTAVRQTDPEPCPYLPHRQASYEIFWADSVPPEALGQWLSEGWRHFGTFFFRTACPGCQACWSLRVAANQLTPSESQRRLLKKNAELEFRTVPTVYNPEYYELWAHHSQKRFQKFPTEVEFVESFFSPASPEASFLTEYRHQGRLAGLGFADVTPQGLNSIYFVFHEDFSKRSLGIYSVLRECQLAAEWGLTWYYLGFWVQGNATMAYKGRFFPRQILSEGVWNDLGELGPT